MEDNRSQAETEVATTPISAARPKEDPKKEESWWDVIKFALITLVIIIPIRWYIAQPFIVSGDSMYPTFHNGEYLIIDELSYNFHTPVRGDVIIFRFPEDPSKYFIKRVIGLPGETVTVLGGKVYITNQNGVRFLLNEPYLSQITNKATSTVVGPDEYFVMGDNRLVSYDSRYWGSVPTKDLRGRAWLRLFPFNKISLWPGLFHSYDQVGTNSTTATGD